MRSFKEFIIEKLKVSKDIKVGPSLRDFIDFYMRNSNWKWADLHNIMFGYDMWGKDKEFKNWEEFKNFLEYNIDKAHGAMLYSIHTRDRNCGNTV